jgi:succinoglycan biosynthesis protein ExoL
MAELVFFASDRAEIAQIRRIRSFRAAGHGVASFSTAKRDGQISAPPDWPDIDLGQISNHALPRRVLRAVLGLGRIWRGRARMRRADALIARNLDMALLALIGRALCGARAPLIYECLDIHSLFTTPGKKAALARWVERRVLARTAVLVVSSPGFVDHYFGPVQGYDGQVALVENKVWFEGTPPARPAAPQAKPGPLVLGWVGTIRCPRSLALLTAAAAARPEDLRIEIHGMVHHHALPDFEATIAAHPNITFAGPYAYPEGLAAVYQRLDLVWAQDLWQAGANSLWLLPNRIYEAGWCGCPCLAVAGTQTGTKIAAEGLGAVIDTASPAALTGWLEALRPTDLTAMRAALAARPGTDFLLTEADLAPVLAPILPPQPKATP